MQDATLTSLMAGDRIVRLLETSTASKNNYSVDELMSDLNKGIFSELKSNTAIDMYRRNIQKLYVDKMIELLKPGTTSVRNGSATRRVNLAQTDLPSIARGQLLNLKNDLKMSNSRMTDRMSK